MHRRMGIKLVRSQLALQVSKQCRVLLDTGSLLDSKQLVERVHCVIHVCELGGKIVDDVIEIFVLKDTGQSAVGITVRTPPREGVLF